MLEREVDIAYSLQMLAALQGKVDAVADAARTTAPSCPYSGQPTRCQDTRALSGLARCGWLHASISRYRCPPCHLPQQCRPLLDLLGVEAGHIRGALARLLADWVRRRRTIQMF
jgi:hypothetical protein